METKKFERYNNGFYGFKAVDENGKPVKKTKLEHPYTYDGFVVLRLGKNEEANNTIYSDRLLQWNYKRYNELSRKHFGNESQVWSDRIYNHKKIEAFLQDWCNDIELKLIFVMEYCNVSTGYPVWRFDVKTIK